MNEELTNSVSLALGGGVVDISDTAVDAIFSGLGGLGFFATVKGLNSARKKYKKGGSGIKSFLEGAGVAITQAAKTLVNTCETVWKVVTSRPSRFIGRNLWKIVKKLFGR